MPVEKIMKDLEKIGWFSGASAAERRRVERNLKKQLDYAKKFGLKTNAHAIGESLGGALIGDEDVDWDQPWTSWLAAYAAWSSKRFVAADVTAKRLDDDEVELSFTFNGVRVAGVVGFRSDDPPYGLVGLANQALQQAKRPERFYEIANGDFATVVFADPKVVRAAQRAGLMPRDLEDPMAGYRPPYKARDPQAGPVVFSVLQAVSFAGAEMEVRAVLQIHHELEVLIDRLPIDLDREDPHWTEPFQPELHAVFTAPRKKMEAAIAKAKERRPTRKDCWDPALALKDLQWLKTNLHKPEILPEVCQRVVTTKIGPHDPKVVAERAQADLGGAIAFCRKAMKAKQLLIRVLPGE